MVKKDAQTKLKGTRSIVKGLGFCGVMSDSNVSVVDINDGKITRIRPLHYDWKYDQLKPWSIEARGQTFHANTKSLIPPFSMAYKKRVYSPNRISYPLRRVDWNPNGNRNSQNRGKSGYVRISWEEALDIVCSEIKRMYKEYGPGAILAQADGHAETQNIHSPHGCQRTLLNILGGFTGQVRNPDSWEGWYWGAKHVWGCEPIGKMIPQTNVFPDAAKHTEMMLFWGCDPETTTWGWQGQLSSKLCYWFTDLGIKQIYICPDLNYGAAVHADKWIPILPNTDAALYLAIAYIWLTEGTYDKAYIATHAYGFDKFEQYVTGQEDGIPKTPQWAQGKCGVPSRVIKALARQWAAKTTSVAHSNGGPAIRGPFSTEPARLEACLLGMQGLGKPGAHSISFVEWGLMAAPWQYPLPSSIANPDVSAATQGQRAGLPSAVTHGKISADEIKMDDIFSKQFVPKTLIHEAILNPPISWYGTTSAGEHVSDQFVQYHYPVAGCSRIHMIWSDTPCLMTCWNDGNSVARAYQHESIEFFLVQHPWMENDCRFADIILPSNTKLEAPKDIGNDFFSGQFHSIFIEEQCVQPVGESMTDFEVVYKIAERLGVADAFMKGKTTDEWIRLGYETSGVADMVSWEELNEKKYWVVPLNEDWQKHEAGLKGFYDDPQANPLETPSGKLEYYSETLAEHFPDDDERPPVPHWIENTETHDERISSKRTRHYPLLCMSNHGRWRLHAQLDDISWFHETVTGKVRGPDGYLYEPCWLNPQTAKERDIVDGDVVEVFNERGAVLCGAYVTERVMPGVAYVDHGSRYDPIAPGELDRGGAINTITPHRLTSKNTSGMACSGFLVQVARADLEALRSQYPEAFDRPIDHASGLVFERVLHQEGG